MRKVLSACRWRCCQFPQILLCPGDNLNQRTRMQSRKQLFPKGSNADEAGRTSHYCGAESFSSGMGVFPSDSSMYAGKALGHLPLCCKGSSLISCVAASETNLLPIQKLQTLPYGCSMLYQGTYQCYFCCLMLTTPQRFCFCFIHNITKDLRSYILGLH